MCKDIQIEWIIHLVNGIDVYTIEKSGFFFFFEKT